MSLQTPQSLVSEITCMILPSLCPSTQQDSIICPLCLLSPRLPPSFPMITRCSEHSPFVMLPMKAACCSVIQYLSLTLFVSLLSIPLYLSFWLTIILLTFSSKTTSPLLLFSSCRFSYCLSSLFIRICLCNTVGLFVL